MNEKYDLKPCPFCGGSDIEISGRIVECMNCCGKAQAIGANSPSVDAVKAWNTRAAQAPGAEPKPEIPTNDVLEDLYQGHIGHVADFAADVLERWGGWQHGLLGYGGALNAQYQPAKPAVPDGWQLVPNQPTIEMRQAFHRANDRYEDDTKAGLSQVD